MTSHMTLVQILLFLAAVAFFTEVIAGQSWRSEANIVLFICAGLAAITLVYAFWTPSE